MRRVHSEPRAGACPSPRSEPVVNLTSVPCPRCQAPAGRRCVTTGTARLSSPHRVRIERLVAEAARSAGARALREVADQIEAAAERTDHVFTEHAVVQAGGAALLREYAEAYGQRTFR
ncbi:zinc finger domain-containing protein [Leucobacter sp. HY1910]